MRIINAGGFNKTERKQFRVVMFNNLVNAFQTLFTAMQEQDTDFEDEQNQVSLHRCVQVVLTGQR
jgi:guanine nucleotide-binding protein subunit alpha, other